MRFDITAADKRALCRRAPEFEPAVKCFDVRPFESDGDLFYALAQSIVSQQLAVRAAEAIFARVAALPGGVTPAGILKASEEELRACGLSARKVEYRRCAATAGASGELDFSSLAAKPDAEVIDALVRLKGVGVWTAEMLLVFSLCRRDVLSYRDLGIRRGVMRLYGVPEPTEAEFEYYRKRYSPYGTLASLYLWRIKDEKNTEDGK